MDLFENKQEHLKDFIRLNEEWISHYFEIEPGDRELAAAPQKVIENGGYIFSLVIDEKVVGVCALFNENEGVFELARMAVSPDYRGRGYANFLMSACLDKLRQLGAKTVYLISNTRLESAISLYKKYGFRTVSEGQHPIYARANILMQLDLSMPVTNT